MILVDTGIIIGFWKNPTDQFKEIFLKHDFAICGIVKSELMHGAKSEKHLKLIIDSLSNFEYIPIGEDIWEYVGKLLYQLRKKGLTIPFQDIVLCALALKHHLILWSNDSHFSLIQKHINRLRLFEY